METRSKRKSVTSTTSSSPASTKSGKGQKKEKTTPLNKKRRLKMSEEQPARRSARLSSSALDSQEPLPVEEKESPASAKKSSSAGRKRKTKSTSNSSSKPEVQVEDSDDAGHPAADPTVDHMEDEEDSEDYDEYGNEGPEFLAFSGMPLGGMQSVRGSSNNRFTNMLSVLNAEGSLAEKMSVLTDLSEFLSMATADMFSGYGGSVSGFHPDAFVKALLKQFKMTHESGFIDPDIPPELAAELGMVTEGGPNPEIMILSCRCLSNLIEALPSCTLSIIHNEGVSVLVEKLLSIEYIDLAESVLSILDKLSGEFPAAILKGNGLMASLQYIDFFNIHVQRTAISIAANACRGLSSYQSRQSSNSEAKSAVALVKEIMPILERLVTYYDARLLENAVRTLIRIVEWAQKLEMSDFEELVTPSLIQVLVNIVNPGTASPVSSSPVVFSMLIKMIAVVIKSSDKYALLLVSDLNILPLIMNVLSGSPQAPAEGTLATAVMNSIVNQPPEQLVAILTVCSDILPALPKSKEWSLSVEQEVGSTQDSSPNKRLQVLKSDANLFERYLTQLLPVLIDVFGITVNPLIRRKCLECIAKPLWYADSETIQKCQLSCLGKFISDLVGLSQNFLSVSNEQDKDAIESKAFVAAGLGIASMLLSKYGHQFRQYFQREGVQSELKKLLDKLQVPSESNAVEVAAPSSITSPVRNDMDDVLMNIVDDFNQLDSQMAAVTSQRPEGSSNENESRLTNMMNSMRTAFASIRREESGQRNPIKALNGESFSTSQVQTWMSATIKDILQAFEVPSANINPNSVFESLVHIRDTLKGKTMDSSLDQLHQLALYLAGSQTAGGLTGFEIIGSGIVQGLISYLTRISDEKRIPSDDETLNPMDESTLQERMSHFYHVFLNGPTMEGTSLYVPDALPRLIARLQECVSRSEGLLLANAIPHSSSSSSSVLALISSLTGRDTISNTTSPSLQLAKQLRIKLQAEDASSVPKQYQAMVISIHAVATFKALEEFLKSRIMIYSQDKRSKEEPESENDSERDSDEEEELEFDGEEEINVSDILIQSEETSRKSRPRGDSINSQKSAASEASAAPTTRVARDSVVEFHPETPTKPSLIPTKAKSKNRKNTTSGPSTRSYAAAGKANVYSITFSINGQEVTKDSTVFGAVYKYEQSKLGNTDSNPNIWNQVCTVIFKKTFEKKKKPVLPERNSDVSLVQESITPYSFFANSGLNVDDESKLTLQLLGILNELCTKWSTVLPWSLGRNLADTDKASLLLIPSSAFINSKITAKLNRQLDEPLIVASRVLPSWCYQVCHEYSFLVPFETRLVHLQSHSFGYSRNMARWQQTSTTSPANDGHPQLGRIQRQKVRISRTRILDSMVKVMESYGSSQALLEVEFFDEVGTGLGPTLEFFALCCQEFRKKSGYTGPHVSLLKLWRDDVSYEDLGAPTTYFNTLFPYPCVVADQELDIERTTHFKALGTLVAKALLDSRVLDMPFSPIFIEMVVFGHSSVDSMAAIATLDPALHKSLSLLSEFVSQRQKIESQGLSEPERQTQLDSIKVEGVSVQDLCLDFTLPGYPDIELVPNGKDTMVTMDNVQDYVKSVVDMTVGQGIKSQVRAFRKGFNRVFPLEDLHSFSILELLILMGGSAQEDWSFETIKDSLHADHGYNKDSRIISDLAQMLSEFSIDEKRLFLQFTTGCPRLPYGGFKALAPPLTVVRKTASSKADDYLPSVMTCVNYLKLPDYSTLQVMRQRFEIAMREGQSCFHLS